MTSIKGIRERLKKNYAEWQKLCYCTGLSSKKLKYKFYNPGRFTLGEVIVIKSVLGLTMDEIIKIFAPKVAERN